MQGYGRSAGAPPQALKPCTRGAQTRLLAPDPTLCTSSQGADPCTPKRTALAVYGAARHGGYGARSARCCPRGVLAWRARSDDETLHPQVRTYYPDATILRSNVIFGEEDNFLNLMAKYTKIWGSIPIMGSGSNMLQPVYVDDVAECVRAAVFETVHAGKTYELNGPEQISLYKTAQWVQEVVWRKDTGKIRRVPDLSDYLPMAGLSPHNVVGAVSNAVLNAWPGDMFGPMSMVGPRGDFKALNGQDWVPNKKLPQIDAFGVVPTHMKKVAPEYLRHYRQGGHYAVIHKADQTGI